jgi:hypothetical protein
MRIVTFRSKRARAFSGLGQISIAVLGHSFYNDLGKGIHILVADIDPLDIPSPVIIADPKGNHIALPTFSGGCNSDRGCRNLLAYSNDGGKSFRWLDHGPVIFDRKATAKDYAFVVTSDSLYIAHNGFRPHPQEPPVEVDVALYSFHDGSSTA